MHNCGPACFCPGHKARDVSVCPLWHTACGPALLEIRMTDHYSTLGLNSAATLADVKKAFRQKASFYHPDRNTAEDAGARFRAVQEAYDVLSDADKRQAYDDNRRRSLLDSPIETAQEIWLNYFNPLL